MKINFKELEDYLSMFGYPKNELMNSDYFIVPDKTSYQYTMDNISKYDTLAMTFFGKKISYEDFAIQIDRTANAMKGVGVNAGDRIATLLPNIPESAYVQYGPSKIGGVVSHIDPRTNSSLLLKFIEKEKIKNIVIVDVMYENAIRPIESILKSKYGIDKVIVVPATNSVPFYIGGLIGLKNFIDGKSRIKSDVLEVIYWNDLLRNTQFENAKSIPFSPDKYALIQHSSGTSKGIPKSIPLTNENINAFVEKHKPTIFADLLPGTTMLHILPYFAAYGAVNSAHLGFNFGLTLQEIPEFNFSDFGLLAAKNKSEILIGVPNWYSLAAKDNRLKKDSLKHVKMAISGGDSNNEKDKEIEDNFLLSHGAQCIETNGHGMSELGGSGSYTFPGHEKGLSVGIPFPYDKYIVVDDNGNIVPMTENGVKGEVYIYSPSAASGIFDNERFAETREFNGFRFINSKDTMHILPNYEISFLERADRTFTRYDGHKIVPSDIENIIKSDNLVKQCMVVSYIDEKYMGKMPIAYVVCSNENITEDEKKLIISNAVNQILSSTEVTSREIPRKFCFLDKLPQNLMSKNDFLALIKRELDGSEYTVDVNETNLAVESVEIIEPKVQSLKLKNCK